MDLGGNFEMGTETHIYNIVFKDYDDVLNVKEVGEILGYSTKTVYKILHNGSLKSIQKSRMFRIPKKHLMEYLELFDFPMYEQTTV
jgi:excisionase family DNA binding protein